MNLQTMEWRPLTEANSKDTDSYTSWSQNSKWFAFTSKRNDGFVGLTHFSYLDENGIASKPFVLPQKDPSFYKSFLKSFNVPEFATGKVKTSLAEIEQAVKGPIIDVKFGWTNDENFGR
jgi:Tol biopolymer transport system component